MTNNGNLTPRSVVDDARPEDAVLHPCFEWDDGVAAGKYREDQARYIIRGVVAQMPEAGEDAAPVRAFVSVVQNDQQSYTSTAHAMSDADLRQQVLQRAWSELQDWRDRYKDYKELAAVFTAIDDGRASATAL